MCTTVLSTVILTEMQDAIFTSRHKNKKSCRTSGFEGVPKIIYVYKMTCCLMQLHLRPAVRQSLRNLPEAATPRCLPAHPQTQSFLIHRRQDRAPHGL